MTRYKKRFFIILGIITLVFAVIILLISPITKYLVEKYDEKYTGRQITMDLAYVNPFTGYIHFRDLKIFELNSDSVFFSTKGFSLNVSVFKLLKNRIDISRFSLDHPHVLIIQNKNQSNFDDLLEKFTANADTSAAPSEFYVRSIKVNNGVFHYREQVIPVDYFIKNVTLNITGISWDVDTIGGNYEFESGISSGKIKGGFNVDTSKKRYRLAVTINKFDLNLIEQYLKELTNYGTLRATLDADIQTNGSYADTADFTLAGMVAINDFHFGKKPGEDYASFDKLMVTMTEISPKKYIFHGDSVFLLKPYFKYEKYDYLDNLQTMFGKDGANIKAVQADSSRFNLILEIADFVNKISEYFFESHYKINQFAVHQADLRYNDFSLSEKFSIDLNPLSIVADSIDKNHPWVHLRLKSGIKPYGELAAGVTINPKDSSDFDIEYNVDKLPLSMFNPYIISIASYPFDRGTVQLQGNWHVRNGKIESRNHLLVIDPRITSRLRNKEIKFLPLRPIMAILREQGNVIDYEIPITGQLNDPKFHPGDIITDILVNIFIKPVRTPYRMRVKNVETEIEKSLALKWPMRQATLIPPQEKFIEKMVRFLETNPEATIEITPHHYSVKEKEYLVFFEAKKKYYLESNNKQINDFNEDDSVNVEKMSVKDKSFVQYVNRQINDSLKFTMQEKCTQLMGPAFIELKFDQLNVMRIALFKDFFKGSNAIRQLTFHPGEEIIPFNGFSYFKINYKGDFPDFLLNAYQKMEELNEERPRSKFRKEREKNTPAPLLNSGIYK